MKSRNQKLLIFLSIFIFMMTSCAPKLIQNQEVADSNTKKVSELVRHLDSLSRSIPTYYFGKASANFSDKENHQSFKATVRMKTDSAITTMITYAGIPIINAVLTSDSIKFQNKRSKCYVNNDMDFIQSVFNVPFNFENVVQLLLGTPIGFDKNFKYYLLPDDTYYVLSTYSSQEKEGNNNYLSSEKRDVIIKYYLSGSGDILDKVELESLKDGVKIVIQYQNRDLTNSHHIPLQINANILTNNNEINLNLNFNKVEINQLQDLNYTVPSNYVECE